REQGLLPRRLKGALRPSRRRAGAQRLCVCVPEWVSGILLTQQTLSSRASGARPVIHNHRRVFCEERRPACLKLDPAYGSRIGAHFVRLFGTTRLSATALTHQPQQLLAIM